VETALSAENPFIETRRFEQGYAWERLRELSGARGPLRVLDYGTHDGNMLRRSTASGIVSSAVGVDVNVDALKSLTVDKDHVTLLPVVKGQALPFPDCSFDAITLIGVLEHVHKQEQLLDDLYRVLKHDGRLIVSVPGQHMFSFLDLGNLKFRFPRIHRWYYTRRHSEHDYVQRYIEGRNGLIGDIEVEKGWHEHFTRVGLKQLLQASGFEVTDEDGFGYFFRIIHNAHWASPIFKRQLSDLMRRDMLAFSHAEIFVECAKSVA